MVARRAATAEQVLEGFSPAVIDLTTRLRALVREAAPDLRERAYPGWRAIGYRHPVAGYVCGVFPAEDGVRLLFEQGVHLPDPHGLLKGDGSQTRYITLREPSAIRREALQTLVREAIAFGVMRRRAAKVR